MGKKQLAETLLTALKTKDWDLFRSLLTDDAVWTLPGSGIISGEARGPEAVVRRGQQIVSYGVSLELQHILYGQYNVALSIHNRAKKGSMELDEHLAAVCTLRDGKISRIDTYLSDVEMVSAFFA